MNDLIERLQSLGKTHDDMSVGVEAADEIVRLRSMLETFILNKQDWDAPGMEAYDAPYQFEANHFSNDRIKVDPVTGVVSIGTPPKMIFDGSAPLVVMPPPVFAKRKWVGLTDEERIACEVQAKSNYYAFASAIETKLKEKNT